MTPAAENPSLIEVLAGALGEPVDPNVQALEKQYLPQFKPVLNRELAFLRRVCEPNEEQLRQVAATAQDRLAVAVRRYATAQNQFRQGRARNASTAMPEPRVLIQQELAAIVEQKLRPEQASHYAEECSQGAEFRKRAVVLNLVARFDKDLALSPDQRQKLIESLTANYQENWGRWLSLVAHNIQVSPQIPENLVLPLLNEKQKTIWRQSPQSDNVWVEGIEFAAPMIIMEDPQIEALGNGF